MFKTLKNNGEIISFLDGNDVRESIDKVVENMQGISNCCGYPVYMDRCSKCKEGCDTEIPGNEDLEMERGSEQLRKDNKKYV